MELAEKEVSEHQFNLYGIGQDETGMNQRIEQAGLDYDKIKKKPGGPKRPRRKNLGKSSTGGYIDVCPA